ncbi:MAG: extensin, partial [Beijerinckiaceae bacterium]|nr:extensin [Beijerinckiaceae bacterium]
ICRPMLGPSPVPEPPRDGLPNPPEIEEDFDIAEGKSPRRETLALQAGPGPAPPARIPDTYFAAAARLPPARAYAPLPPEPVGAPLREKTGRAPEGRPSDWDLTSSIPSR